MKGLFVSTVIIAGLIFTAVSVNADRQSTIESCSTLLPAGYQFKMDITGTIDTAAGSDGFQVKFNLSDQMAEDNPDMQAAVKPFLNCAMPLIKSGVAPI